jgi:hypothetical protein
LLLINGIDFTIFELRVHGFNESWYSHKHNGPGVRYEVATCINSGDIVWFHGPFPCGSFPDLQIFRLGLKSRLRIGEKVVADRGYRGDPKCTNPDQARSDEHGREMARVRARHETINGRFTDFGCLSQVYRHDRNKHHFLFKTIAVITQLEIQNGHPPYAITA